MPEHDLIQSTPTPRTRATLAADLQTLGLHAGMTVLVHSWLGAMPRVLIMLIVGLILAGCSTPPPVQGPAVQGDGVVIEDWQYLGPEAVNEPPAAANVSAFGADAYEAWVIWTDAGFDLVYAHFPCPTQPVLIVHAGSMELWPGAHVNANCGASRVYHKITVALQTDVPPEQWRFTLHPPAR